MQPARVRQPHAPAELQTFGRRAVIVVNPTSSLERQPGVHLVPIPDGRALISFDRRLSVQEIELRLTDALEDAALAADDRAMFESLARILRDARRSGRMALRERSIIVLQHVRPSRRRISSK
jgi:hypothetical protein